MNHSHKKGIVEMDAKNKFLKLIARSLGITSLMIEEIKEPSIKASGKMTEMVTGKTQRSGDEDSGMIRVTDPVGHEFLCPANVTDGSFVDESETRNCFDYNSISTHAPME